MYLNMTAGLWVVMCRYSFIDCNKYTILMCNVSVEEAVCGGDGRDNVHGDSGTFCSILLVTLRQL